MMVSDLSLGFVPGTNASFLAPADSGGSSSPPQDSTIAPWLSTEENNPPTPPPKPGQRFIPNKPSFSSFVSGVSHRAGSVPHLPYHNHRSHRPSDTLSFESSGNESISTNSSKDLHKPKSSINLLSNMMKKRSRSKLRDDVSIQSRSFSIPPPPPLPSFLPMTPVKKEKARVKKRPWPTNGSSSTLSQGHLSPAPEPVFRLDTNLDEMEGIVNPNHGLDSSSISSGVESSYFSDLGFHSPGAPPTFSDPFLPGSLVPKRRKLEPYRKISPNTILPDINVVKADEEGGPSWTAPESWAVEKEGVEKQEPEYSSSDEDNSAVTMAGTGSSSNPGSKRKSRHNRRTVPPRTVTKLPILTKPFKIRIYRANNTYHVVSVGLSVTVADLTSQLLKRLLDPERETHRLYLKEKGRERMLALTEKPADIVRRRLEQAGYTPADGLDMLGTEDMRFLMTFVYKSNLLGPAEEELAFDDFEYVDLTGRSLKTVPVVLHKHADTIIVLNLSRNPMLEIPLDFIQACTTLRDLRLSYMAMKKVPQSVRHCFTLQRLDLSCNRIVDLDDAGLDRLSELTTLKVQNNRMERLPWYFPRLRSLKYLNISNNKFQDLPAVVTQIEGLLDLDFSFNMISELPEEIKNLRSLEKLVVVGNQVTKIPEECSNLVNLRILDCRRNNISDLTAVCMLPKLEILLADHNSVHSLELSLGPSVSEVVASHNDITQLTLLPGPIGQPYALSSLDISHAKLASLDDFALSHLISLRSLKLDHNLIRFIPDSIGDLHRLVTLSCSNNQLYALPATLGKLQKLENLDVHNNSIAEIPVTLWNCASLCHVNFTSNLISLWHEPASIGGVATVISESPSDPPFRTGSVSSERKGSTAGSATGSLANGNTGRMMPPLVYSLERLYLGENKLTEEGLGLLTLMRELRVLNLSFNLIQELPPSFFKNLLNLEELYLSGNHLSNIPTEDLHRLKRLQVLFLNGNNLQTLPQELGKVQSLTALDVGSNVLKYNINNWEFDWNWNFNQNLRYLNLSGNKRLEIKPDTSQKISKDQPQRKVLADFSSLTQLRILGLMDVTTIFVPTIPDENEDRRVRTSLSEVNKMAYGIADTLGKTDHVTMFDLVLPEFRKNEAIFAMFGRSQPIASNNRLSKYLHDQFSAVFSKHLDQLDSSKGEGVPDALRRTFLRLNKLMYDFLSSNSYNNRKMSHASASTAPIASIPEKSSGRSGASGIVVYVADKTLYVANAGNALAVVSRHGQPIELSRKHDPFERSETARIRAAEGWVSPKGFTNDEIDISRSFGFFHLLPVVNACPDVYTWDMNELDEFVIIGNRGLWDFVSSQTAVDIARTEREDPMIAAQKLRDFAISYGADGCTMIMVIKISDLFNSKSRERLPTADSIHDSEVFLPTRRRRKDRINHLPTDRLGDGIEAPRGHIALVFTDIRNSTHLWEANAGMPTAMIYHNNLLRRQLRLCQGYEVKTEGDAFMCSFTTVLDALWWCLLVQVELLNLDWPTEILECDDGKEIRDSSGRLVARGLSVRMGIHCGYPVCEPDPNTTRMDYFGPMVNRAARINSSALGGQIMCSADIIREINAKIFETELETEFSYLQHPHAVEAIRTLGVVVEPVGEVKLKGLEVPEMLSVVYPRDLAGRHSMEHETMVNGPSSTVQFTADQVRALALLCVRFEALTASRIFHPLLERKGSAPNGLADEGQNNSPLRFSCNPKVLLPTLEKASDAEVLEVLGSLTLRLENAVKMLVLQHMTGRGVFRDAAGDLSHTLTLASLDERTLGQILAVLDDT